MYKTDYRFTKSRISDSTHPVRLQQDCGTKSVLPTQLNYLKQKSSKPVLNRQNSGLSTSMPLPPISKGKFKGSSYPIGTCHVIHYTYTMLKGKQFI